MGYLIVGLLVTALCAWSYRNARLDEERRFFLESMNGHYAAFPGNVFQEMIDAFKHAGWQVERTPPNSILAGFSGVHYVSYRKRVGTTEHYHKRPDSGMREHVGSSEHYQDFTRAVYWHILARAVISEPGGVETNCRIVWEFTPGGDVPAYDQQWNRCQPIIGSIAKRYGVLNKADELESVRGARFFASCILVSCLVAACGASWCWSQSFLTASNNTTVASGSPPLSSASTPASESVSHELSPGQGESALKEFSLESTELSRPSTSLPSEDPAPTDAASEAGAGLTIEQPPTKTDDSVGQGGEGSESQASAASAGGETKTILDNDSIHGQSFETRKLFELFRKRVKSTFKPPKNSKGMESVLLIAAVENSLDCTIENSSGNPAFDQACIDAVKSNSFVVEHSSELTSNGPWRFKFKNGFWGCSVK